MQTAQQDGEFEDDEVVGPVLPAKSKWIEDGPSDDDDENDLMDNGNDNHSTQIKAKVNIIVSTNGANNSKVSKADELFSKTGRPEYIFASKKIFELDVFSAGKSSGEVPVIPADDEDIDLTERDKKVAFEPQLTLQNMTMPNSSRKHTHEQHSDSRSSQKRGRGHNEKEKRNGSRGKDDPSSAKVGHIFTFYRFL